MDKASDYINSDKNFMTIEKVNENINSLVTLGVETEQVHHLFSIRSYLETIKKVIDNSKRFSLASNNKQEILSVH